MTYTGSDRRATHRPDAEVEPIVLTKKLADALNGIVLAGFKVGDRMCLARKQAAMLIAEGWACPAPAQQRRRSPT